MRQEFKPKRTASDILREDIKNHPLKKQSTMQSISESKEYRRDKEVLMKIVDEDKKMNDKLKNELNMMMLRSEQERLKKKI